MFFEWLQNGIEKGELKINQLRTRIHVVDEGVILITPGIFQDFALSDESDKSKWAAIQKKVLKKNWHFRDKQGLNVVKYQVKGQKKLTTVNTILFHDVSLVFGSMEPPTSNPHLLKID